MQHENVIVRKILSEALIAVGWNPEGTGVMLPPFTKAKRQAEFLQALPDPARRYFPHVFDILEREIQVPTHYLKETDRLTFKELIYEMSFVPGEEVSRYVERCSPPPAIIARIYEQIALVLRNDVHSLRRVRSPGNTLETSYFRKIEDRLDLCRSTAAKHFQRKAVGYEPHYYQRGTLPKLPDNPEHPARKRGLLRHARATLPCPRHG